MRAEGGGCPTADRALLERVLRYWRKSLFRRLDSGAVYLSLCEIVMCYTTDLSGGTLL